MASRSLNKVLLIGNLTRDPELRYTPSGTAVCSFGLATNRSWMPSDGGERQESTEFHRIVAWQKLAELCSQLLFKGRKVFVEGRLQSRRWTGQDGMERTTTEVVIDNMIILDSRRREEEGMEGSADFDQRAAATPVAATVPDVSDDTSKPSPAKPAVKAKKTNTAKKVENEEVKESEVKEEVKADDIPF